MLNWLTDDGKRVNVDKVNNQVALDEIATKIAERTGDDFIKQYWMQDGASCHNAGTTIDYLKVAFKDRYIATKENSEGLFWPPYSCEMNVLERNVWVILEDRVNKSE